jgi:hypothetical protein
MLQRAKTLLKNPEIMRSNRTNFATQLTEIFKGSINVGF